MPQILRRRAQSGQPGQQQPAAEAPPLCDRWKRRARGRRRVPWPCAVAGPQRLCTARTARAQASALGLQGPACTQTTRRRSVRPRAVLTACTAPCAQVHDGGLAHPFADTSRTSSSSSRLTSTAGSSRRGASRPGRSVWMRLALLDSLHEVPVNRGRACIPITRKQRPSMHFCIMHIY